MLGFVHHASVFAGNSHNKLIRTLPKPNLEESFFAVHDVDSSLAVTLLAYAPCYITLQWVRSSVPLWSQEN